MYRSLEKGVVVKQYIIHLETNFYIYIVFLFIYKLLM